MVSMTTATLLGEKWAILHLRFYLGILGTCHISQIYIVLECYYYKLLEGERILVL